MVVSVEEGALSMKKKKLAKSDASFANEMKAILLHKQVQRSNDGDIFHLTQKSQW